MQSPRPGSARALSLVLCKARAQLVALRRMRTDRKSDEHCERAIDRLDALLEMLQTGGTEHHWHQCILECNAAIMFGVIDYIDAEFSATLAATHRALQEAGIFPST